MADIWVSVRGLIGVPARQAPFLLQGELRLKSCTDLQVSPTCFCGALGRYA